MGVWSWNLSWRRVLYDWEANDVVRLVNVIDLKKPYWETNDSVLWNGSGASLYPVKQIVDKAYVSSTPIIPNSIIHSVWRSYIPPGLN